MNGEWKFYRKTDQLWQVGNFKNNIKGPWIQHDKNEITAYNKDFEAGKIIRKSK
tara:strand:+ start:106821 stop:106982 length:162 start_codon:yes stop_codon:yes gene_type:complete